MAIHAWMESDPTGGGCSLKALMGDMNAYAMEDPVKYFESVGYTDTDFRFNGDGAYSYVFDGQVGTLDYVLANAAFNNLITGASSWHVNADEAAALDYNTDFGKDKMIFDADATVRFSDHDPMVVGFNLEATTEPTNPPTTEPTNPPTTASTNSPTSKSSKLSKSAKAKTPKNTKAKTPKNMKV